MGLTTSIGDYTNPRSLGSRFRRRRFAPLKRVFERIHAAKGRVEILDVGGRESYWNIVPADELAALGARITLLNLPEDCDPVERDDVFVAVAGDGCALPWPDRSFDVSHSNSVIEHVFGWQNKVAFAREAMRVADVWFHQTPNFWFPWEPHFGMPFFHWMPEPWRIALTMRRRLAWSERSRDVDEAMRVVELASLLCHAQVAHLFPGATIRRERLAGLTKSFVATRGVPVD